MSTMNISTYRQRKLQGKKTCLIYGHEAPFSLTETSLLCTVCPHQHHPVMSCFENV